MFTRSRNHMRPIVLALAISFCACAHAVPAKPANLAAVYVHAVDPDAKFLVFDGDGPDAVLTFSHLSLLYCQTNTAKRTTCALLADMNPKPAAATAPPVHEGSKPDAAKADTTPMHEGSKPPVDPKVDPTKVDPAPAKPAPPAKAPKK